MAHLSGRTLGALAPFFTHSFISSIPECQLDQEHEAEIRAVAHQLGLSDFGDPGTCLWSFLPPHGCPGRAGRRGGRALCHPSLVSSVKKTAFLAAPGELTGRRESEGQWLPWSDALLDGLLFP